MVTKDYKGEFLVVSLLILGVLTSYTINETGQSAVCRGGQWVLIGEPSLYICSVNDREETCHHLSSTSKTCYLGIIVEKTEQIISEKIIEKPVRSGGYHCYPEKGYARKGGLLSEPKVDYDEVCG